MPRADVPDHLRRTGRKRGWPTVTGQVSPAVAGYLNDLQKQRGIEFRTDLVREAIEELLRTYGYPIEAA